MSHYIFEAIQSIDSKLDGISVSVYYWLIGILYALYFGSIFGIARVDPKYTDYINVGVRIFIAVILLIRFNPFRRLNCTSNDRVMIMASAVFLLINEGVSSWARQSFQDFTHINIPRIASDNDIEGLIRF